MKRTLLVWFGILLSCSPKMEPPKVTKVYPSSDTLPENLLRMYVQFSQSMKTVGNLEKIRLIDENGNEVKGAIFNNVHELWNENQTQLTLIFDPARVKTGLRANEDLGRALQSGSYYELHINHLENIQHQVQEEPFVKKFYVADPDSRSPDIDAWTMVSPHVRTQDPLKLVFPEMVDQMSLHSRLVIVNGKDEVVSGTTFVTNNEKEWNFVPFTSWEEDTYTLLVNARLADPSGNNLNGLFDHSVDALKYKAEGEILKLTFELNKASLD